MTLSQTFHIDGMHCGACVNRLTSALKKVPGVEVDDVQVGSARIRAADSDVVRAAEQVIQKAGFTVRHE